MLKRFALVILLAVMLAGSVLTPTHDVQAAPAQTCSELDGAYVLSQEANPVYLGFFGSRFASESVMNSFGPFGSRFASSSMWNKLGAYGSSFQPYSAFSSFSQTPPRIFKNGVLLGFVTTNPNIIGGIPLTEIADSCNFFAMAPSTPNPLPPPPVPVAPASVSASDGLFTDKVVVQWTSVQGASSYVVGWSVSPDGPPTFGDPVTGTSVEIVGLADDVVYDFGVAALNNVGNSNFTFDTGYIASAAQPTLVPSPSPSPSPEPSPSPDPTATPGPGIKPSMYLPVIVKPTK